MIDIDELSKHISYNALTGECYRIGYRDSHGNLVACNYLIKGKTKTGKYGYIRVSISGKRYVLHKLVYFLETGNWPETIDHIDGNCQNNRFNNLRATDRLGNMRNLKLRTDNPTGHIGVAIKHGKYYAHAQRNGERLFAGYFETIEEAIDARQKMNTIYDFHENHGSTR
jgi:HNH endonuclease